MYIVLMTVNWPHGPTKSVYGPYLCREEAALAGQRIASYIPAPTRPVVYAVDADYGMLGIEESLSCDFGLSRPGMVEAAAC